jgi:hypothetical protein
VRVRDDPQTQNDQITLCGRKILWVEEMGGNFKHYNITLSFLPRLLDRDFHVFLYILPRENGIKELLELL